SCSESTSGIGMKSAAVKFHLLSNSVQTLRSSLRRRGHFRDRRRPCSKCCEASHPPIVLRASLAQPRSSPPSQVCSLVISSGGLGRETRTHTVRSNNAAARPPSRAEKSAILLGRWRHSAGAPRGLALVRSA